MKAMKAAASIFTLPIMLTVKVCELIFVTPVKAITKGTKKQGRRNKR